MTFQAYPTLSTYTVLTGLCTRLEATDSSTRAMGGWPLQKARVAPGAFTGANATLRPYSVWLNKGAGFAEVAFYSVGLGRYDDDSYRSLYIEVVVDNTVPVYPAITSANASARKSAVPAGTSAGWVMEVRFGTAATITHLTRAVNNTGTPASMWEDMTAGVDGECPAAWEADVTKMGRTNAVCLPTDPTYLSKCGAFPWQLTRAEEEASATVGAKAAALAVQRNDDFDRVLRDLMWNGLVWSGRSDTLYSNRQYQFSLRNTGNASFTDEIGQAHDFTDVRRNTGYPAAADPSWVGTPPPKHGQWRAAVGGTIYANTLDWNYYDRAQKYRKKWCATGDLAYYQRFAATAFAYRHYLRFKENGTSVQGYTADYGNSYKYQPQGIGEYYLTSGDPHSFTMIETVANTTPNDAYFGDATSYGVNTPAGEPRPMARIGHLTRWAYLLSRPANASYPEGNVAGTNTVEVRDWHANLVTKIGQALDGSCHATSVAGVTTFANGACIAGTCYEGFPVPGPQDNYWQTISGASAGMAYRASTRGITAPTLYTGATVENVGVSTFMQPIVTEWLKCCAHDHPLIGATLQQRIADAIGACARYLYATWWDGTPLDNPVVQPQVGPYPAFRAIFAADLNADQSAYYFARQDITLMYAWMFSYAAWQTSNAELQGLAERILTAGQTSADQKQSKQVEESHVYMEEAFAPMALGPAAGAITTYDVAAEVKLSATSGTLNQSGFASITAQIRDTRRVNLLVTPVVTASHPTIASGAVTNTVDDVYGRTSTVTITAGTTPGESTIWVTDPTTQITSSYLVRVNAPQFTEPFDTDITTRPGVWSTSIAGPGAFANAPSGELRVGTTSATFSTITAKASMVATCSLDAALATGVSFQWTSVTNRGNIQSEVWLVDGSGNGFGIQTMNGGSFSAQSVTVAANVASSGVGFLAVGTQDVPMWFRFRKSGTSYAIDHSPDGSAWTAWTTGTLASANNPVTTAMRLVVIGHENGSATEARFDNISWADGSAPVGPADPYSPTGGIAHHLALSVTARAGLAGQLLATQPVIAVQDSGSSTVTTDTTSVVAALVVTSGAATPTGTLTKVAVSGLATFTDLGLASSSVIGSVCHWRYSRAGLPDLDGPSFTVLTSLAPSVR